MDILKAIKTFRAAAQHVAADRGKRVMPVRDDRADKLGLRITQAERRRFRRMSSRQK